MTSGAAVIAMLGIAWVGCDAGGGTSFSTGGNEGGEGGTADLPCGIDCSSIQTDQCHEAVCDMVTLQCAVVPLESEERIECDDGLFCTIDDYCSEGNCIGGALNTCQLMPAPCQEVTCTEEFKTCSTATLANGTACDSTDPCIEGATCTNGLCLGSVKDCFLAPTPNQCHVSVCNSSTGTCEPVPGNNGFQCVDYDNLCNAGGICSAGVCAGGTPKDCTFIGDDCNSGVCDDMSGVCGKTPANEGGGCDDFDGCTNLEQCTTGACAGTTIVACAHDDGCCASGCTLAQDNDCQTILLMGDDVPATGWNPFREALVAAGRQWDEIDLFTGTPFPSAAALSAYDTIIFFTDGFTDTPAAGPVNPQLLADWLTSGGERNMFLTSKDFAQDWNNAGTGESGEQNLYDLMDITYMGSSAGFSVQTLDGVASDPITDEFTAPNGLVLTQDAFSSGDWLNETMGTADHIAIYTGGVGSGLTHSGMIKRDTGTYQIVYLAVNFYNGLEQQDQRNRLMVNVLEWFKN